MIPALKIKKAFLSSLLFVFLILLVTEAILQGLTLYNRHSAIISSSDFDKQESFRILAIGESTTYMGGENSYPAILQQRLQNDFKLKAEVINAGVPGSNTQRLLEKLPELLKHFRPKLVLFMVGINDGRSLYPSFITHKWQSRLWDFLGHSKILRWLQNSMLMKEQEDFLSFPSEEDFWRNQLANVDWTKSCPNNVACWKKDLHQSFVTSQETEWKELLQQHQEQIEAKPELDDVSKFLLLRKLFHKFGQGEFSVEDAREIFNLCQWNCSETEKIRIIKIIQFKKWHTDFESQLKLLQQEPQQSILRAQLLKNTLQREASAFVFSQPEEAFRNPITQKNITSMHKLVEDAGAKSYFVQYPTLPTADLSKLLAGLNTRVIDNQSNFQAALAKYRYEELFVDKFGGSFGHATKLGNEILVESILKTLESEKVISK